MTIWTAIILISIMNIIYLKLGTKHKNSLRTTILQYLTTNQHFPLKVLIYHVAFDNNDWTNYKNAKATLNQQIVTQKTEYINKKLNNRWKTIKDLNNTNKTQSPRNITHNNKVYNNIEEICNLANSFYINIVTTLRNRLQNSD